MIFLKIYFRQIIKDHVGILRLRWHAAHEKDRKLKINRKDFKVTPWTVVCSNHFTAGYYSHAGCTIPTLFMKGYDVPDLSSHLPSALIMYFGRGTMMNQVILNQSIPHQCMITATLRLFQFHLLESILLYSLVVVLTAVKKLTNWKKMRINYLRKSCL